MTIQSKFTKTLTDAGWKINTESRTKKYIELSHLCMMRKIFLGKNGAVRVGETSTKSISIDAKYAQQAINSRAHAARDYDARIAAIRAKSVREADVNEIVEMESRDSISLDELAEGMADLMTMADFLGVTR